MKNRAFLYIIMAVFFGTSLPAFSQELQSFGVFHDTLWLENSDSDSAPSPILSVWGLSARFGFGERLSLAPELSFSSVEYLYRDGIALPAEIEYADAVKTINIIISSPVAFRFVPAQDMSIYLGTGPAFSFKVPVKTYGEASAGDVAGYFVKRGRFFHWEAAAGFDWKFYESLAFNIRARLLLPLYRAWDGDGMPLYDGMMFGVGFGLRVILK